MLGRVVFIAVVLSSVSGCQYNFPVLIGTKGQCSRFSVAGHTWGKTDAEIWTDAEKTTAFMCGGKAKLLEAKPWVRDGQSHWGAIFECCDY